VIFLREDLIGETTLDFVRRSSGGVVGTANASTGRMVDVGGGNDEDWDVRSKL
jgi:hypothetical protein